MKFLITDKGYVLLRPNNATNYYYRHNLFNIIVIWG